jgi:hypothetical protein
MQRKLAYKWERDSISHIAQAIEKSEYTNIIDIPIEVQNKIVPSQEILTQHQKFIF